MQKIDLADLYIGKAVILMDKTVKQIFVSSHRVQTILKTDMLTDHFKCVYFGSTYTKIGTTQRRLAWPLRKDDTQNREAFHIFCPH